MDGAAAAEPAAVAAVLSGLLADVAASVRPTLDKEKEDLQHDPDLGTRPVRIRRNAEALLAAAERVNAPAFRQQHAALWPALAAERVNASAFRQQHAALWPALAAELDRRLTEACYASIYGEDDWDDDHSTVWGRLEGRPSAQAVAVKSSLGSPYGRRAVSAGDHLISMLKSFVPPDKLQELEGKLEDFAPSKNSSASSQRPELASPLSRFDASYGAAAAAAGGAGSSAGAAVAEARCEVTTDLLPAAAGWLRLETCWRLQAPLDGSSAAPSCRRGASAGESRRLQQSRTMKRQLRRRRKWRRRTMRREATGRRGFAPFQPAFTTRATLLRWTQSAAWCGPAAARIASKPLHSMATAPALRPAAAASPWPAPNEFWRSWAAGCWRRAHTMTSAAWCIGTLTGSRRSATGLVLASCLGTAVGMRIRRTRSRGSTAAGC